VKLKTFLFGLLLLPIIIATELRIYGATKSYFFVIGFLVLLGIVYYLFSKKFPKDLFPNWYYVALIAFLYSAPVLGTNFGFYGTFWFWDDYLHAFSGVLYGFLGYFILKFIADKNKIKLNGTIIFLFVISFAIALGTLWEVYEFIGDSLFGTSMQSWDGRNVILMGKPYQGASLRDTMGDIIYHVLGGLVAAIVSVKIYNKKRTK